MTPVGHCTHISSGNSIPGYTRSALQPLPYMRAHEVFISWLPYDYGSEGSNYRTCCLLASLYGIAGLDFNYTCGKLLSKHCCNRGLQRVPTPMNHERMTPNGLGIGTLVRHIGVSVVVPER